MNNKDVKLSYFVLQIIAEQIRNRMWQFLAYVIKTKVMPVKLDLIWLQTA